MQKEIEINENVVFTNNVHLRTYFERKSIQVSGQSILVEAEYIVSHRLASLVIFNLS